MLREVIRKLRGGFILSALWATAIGLLSFIIVLAAHLIAGSTPTREDLIEIPFFFAVGGFVLGSFFSAGLVLGTRNGRLSRLKAGILGALAGPVVMALLNVSRGMDFSQGLLPGGVMMGLLIGLLGAFTVGVAGVEEGASNDSSEEPATEPIDPTKLEGPGLPDRMRDLSMSGSDLERG